MTWLATTHQTQYPFKILPGSSVLLRAVNQTENSCHMNNFSYSLKVNDLVQNPRNVTNACKLCESVAANASVNAAFPIFLYLGSEPITQHTLFFSKAFLSDSIFNHIKWRVFYHG